MDFIFILATIILALAPGTQALPGWLTPPADGVLGEYDPHQYDAYGAQVVPVYGHYSYGGYGPQPTISKNEITPVSSAAGRATSSSDPDASKLTILELSPSDNSFRPLLTLSGSKVTASTAATASLYTSLHSSVLITGLTDPTSSYNTGSASSTDGSESPSTIEATPATSSYYPQPSTKSFGSDSSLLTTSSDTLDPTISVKVLSSNTAVPTLLSPLASLVTALDISSSTHTTSSINAGFTEYYDPSMPAYGNVFTVSASSVGNNVGVSVTSTSAESSVTSGLFAAITSRSLGSVPTAKDSFSLPSFTTTSDPNDPLASSVRSFPEASTVFSLTAFQDPPTIAISFASDSISSGKLLSTLVASAATNPTTLVSLQTNCNRDNCFRQLNRASIFGQQFCASYTATQNTATTEFPTFVSVCGNNPTKVSSACSCVETGSGFPTSVFSNDGTITDPSSRTISTSTSYSDLETFPTVVLTSLLDVSETTFTVIPTSAPTTAATTDVTVSSSIFTSKHISISSTVPYPMFNSSVITGPTALGNLTTLSQRARSTVTRTSTITVPANTLLSTFDTPSSTFDSDIELSASAISTGSEIFISFSESGSATGSSKDSPTSYAIFNPSIDLVSFSFGTVLSHPAPGSIGFSTIVYPSPSRSYPVSDTTPLGSPMSRDPDLSSVQDVNSAKVQSTTTSVIYSPFSNTPYSAQPSETATYPSPVDTTVGGNSGTSVTRVPYPCNSSAVYGGTGTPYDPTTGFSTGISLADGSLTSSATYLLVNTTVITSLTFSIEIGSPTTDFSAPNTGSISTTFATGNITSESFATGTSIENTLGTLSTGGLSSSGVSMTLYLGNSTSSPTSDPNLSTSVSGNSGISTTSASDPDPSTTEQKPSSSERTFSASIYPQSVSTPPCSNICTTSSNLDPSNSFGPLSRSTSASQGASNFSTLISGVSGVTTSRELQGSFTTTPTVAPSVTFSTSQTEVIQTSSSDQTFGTQSFPSDTTCTENPGGSTSRLIQTISSAGPISKTTAKSVLIPSTFVTMTGSAPVESSAGVHDSTSSYEGSTSVSNISGGETSSPSLTTSTSISSSPPPTYSFPPSYNPDPYQSPSYGPSPDDKPTLEDMIAAWIAKLEAEKDAEEAMIH
ncbi:hypothetical protein GLAREA_12039 [Glarea lozoyensis ATCC 20868]|uniref:Uncharacterized protein n=1 Tax=Glarea lozoyensis (strain ATCC 20868 / MF5171) TaxID=1116229 RepID=S3D0A8_GLAL2|nr:uncharacterized protein GLAREA_12039 [Glarea lozoyensis ATCC 20868]EPE31957.1 hypothetical protein GLAREA_12039 [Glarea lozoyensis ATCC 20868]